MGVSGLLPTFRPTGRVYFRIVVVTDIASLRDGFIFESGLLPTFRPYGTHPLAGMGGERSSTDLSSLRDGFIFESWLLPTLRPYGTNPLAGMGVSGLLPTFRPYGTGLFSNRGCYRYCVPTGRVFCDSLRAASPCVALNRVESQLDRWHSAIFRGSVRYCCPSGAECR